MTAQFAQPTPFDEERYLRDQALKNKRFALQLWRVANGMVFVFLIFANYLMRSVQATWPPAGIPRADALIPALFTIVLLLSAIPATRTQGAISREDRVGLGRNILATFGLAILFLVGIAVMWSQLIPGSAYSSIFYVMLGFHALHVVAGLLLFGYVYAKSKTYTKENHWGVEAAAVFWQFVALMWIFFFLVLYIV